MRHNKNMLISLEMQEARKAIKSG